MSQKLVEIPRIDWYNLLKLYSKHKKLASTYGLLKTAIRWFEIEPTLNIKIYTLDNDWQKEGTFLLIDYDLHVIQIYCNTLSNNLERLIQAMNCLNMKVTYRFCGVPEKNVPAIKAHHKHMELIDDQMSCIPTVWYHIEKEKALLFSAEPQLDITLSTLQLQHAEQINEVWPHHATNSVIFVQRLIRLNDNIGAFDKSGRLVAWCLRLPVGSLGLLFVVDSYRRQGLGSLLTRYMARKIALQEEEVVAPVLPSNFASRSMFEKLGFSVIDKVYWFTMKLKNDC